MTLTFLKQSPVYAKRCETSVIFAFREAEPPLVWRYDLSRDSCFTLTIRDCDTRCEIGFVQPGGEFSKVASFPEREQAEEALFRIARMIGTPFIRWGRVLLASVILALAAFAIASILCSYMANARFAQEQPQPQLASSSSGFPNLPPILNGGYAAQESASNPGFPRLSAPPNQFSPYGGTTAQPRYVLKPTVPPTSTNAQDLQKTGIPLDADEFLKASESTP